MLPPEPLAALPPAAPFGNHPACHPTPATNITPAPQPHPSCLQTWEVVKKTATKIRLQLGGASLPALVTAELRYSPAQLEVAVGGAPVLVWNDARQFVFEHLREKQVGVVGG